MSEQILPYPPIAWPAFDEIQVSQNGRTFTTTNPARFLARFGSGVTPTRAASWYGAPTALVRRMQARGWLPKEGAQTKPVRGLEHLPGLPSHTIVHQWAGGTTYRINTRGCPSGVCAITIHNKFVVEDMSE